MKTEKGVGKTYQKMRKEQGRLDGKGGSKAIERSQRRKKLNEKKRREKGKINGRKCAGMPRFADTKKIS